MGEGLGLSPIVDIFVQSPNLTADQHLAPIVEHGGVRRGGDLGMLESLS